MSEEPIVVRAALQPARDEADVRDVVVRAWCRPRFPCAGPERGSLARRLAVNVGVFNDPADPQIITYRLFAGRQLSHANRFFGPALSLSGQRRLSFSE